MQNFFDFASQRGEEYAGSVYAYAFLTEAPKPDLTEPEYTPHWRNRLYAALGPAVGFDVPLFLSDHADVLPRPVSGITILSSQQFLELKKRLREEGNELGELDRVSPGRDDLREITLRNWKKTACGSDIVFSCEADVRGYFADHFLREVADVGTAVYHEVKCLKRKRGGKFVGSCRADYLISLNKRWLPVEAKLSVWTWPDIGDQIQPYLHADMFQVSLQDGNKSFQPAGTSDALKWEWCLVIDREGVYLVDTQGYSAGSPGAPLITRGEVGGLSGSQLRSRLLVALEYSLLSI